MPGFIKIGFWKRLLATGICLLAWAHFPLQGDDWSWTPIQFGLVPLSYLQFPPHYVDVYGISAGGVLGQQRSAALSVALWNYADANFLVKLGLLGALNDNNYALNVGGVFAGNYQCNCGVNMGISASSFPNYGVNLGVGTINDVNYGVNVGGFSRIRKVNYGLDLGLVPCCRCNKGLSVGVYNVVGASGLFDWKFDTDARDSGGVQIGVLNVGCGFQLGLLNYNPCGPVKLLPLVNFYCH